MPDTLPASFTYELACIPTSLFDASGLPREANKSSLADYLWSTLGDDGNGTRLPQGAVSYVIDGGSLLHRVPWRRGQTYNELAKMYVEFIARKYRKATVVFDGYPDSPTTKDITHMRRTGHKKSGAEVSFTGDMVFDDKKDAFLSNTSNKVRFIHLQRAALSENGFPNLQAHDDADCLIVQQALSTAEEDAVVVVGEDTDLLVMLLYHVSSIHKEVFFCPGGGMSTVKQVRIWDIKKTQRALQQEACEGILFVHAISGCDTTSRLFQIGKGHTMKQYTSDPHFRKQAKVFCCTSSSQSDVMEAGEAATVSLYGGKEDDSLDSLRFLKYMQKVSTAVKCIQPNTLPPTAAAAKYHSFRTYLQVQRWMSLDNCLLDPTQWGWEKLQGTLFPKFTDMPAAPDELLKVIRCGCKTGCAANTNCTCRTYGLTCSSSCGDCRGISCDNSPGEIVVLDSDFDSECED